MDIQTQHWVAVDHSPTPNSTTYQFIQTVEINGEEGIFAVMTEALPCLHHSTAYYALNQRSQQGAEIAVDAAIQAFDTLLERQLNFSRDFMNILTKNWNHSISLHFISHPINGVESQKDKNQRHNTFTNQSPNGLLNLSNLYDTAISAVLLTNKELLVYQVGHSQLLLLNKQHTIKIKTQKRELYAPFSQFLAHTDMANTYPCQHIDLNDYPLEMLILSTSQYNTTKTTRQVHDHAYQIARELDTQGIHYVKQFYTPSHNASQLIIKRNRRWYDGVISALNRESHHLHNKIEQQNQQLYTLETKIYQLHQSYQPIQTQHEAEKTQQPTSVITPKPTPKRQRFLLITLSTLTLTALSLIGYSLWQHTLIDSRIHQAVLAPSPLESQKTASHLSRNTQLVATLPPLKNPIITTVFSGSALFQNTLKNQRVGLHRYTHFNRLQPVGITPARPHSQQTTQQSAIEKKPNTAATTRIKIPSENIIVARLNQNKQHASALLVPPQIATPKKETTSSKRIIKKSKKPKAVSKKPAKTPRKTKNKKNKKPQPKKRTNHIKPSSPRPLIVAKVDKKTNITLPRKVITKTVPRQQKVNIAALKIQAQRKQAQKKLENTQKQTIVQQIITNSTAFASHALRLNKKNKEISIMNELFVATKHQQYAQQQKLLERRKRQLNQKMQRLSQQYAQQLKRLCRYTLPYNPRLLPQATPLEQLALRNLKQHLRQCSQPNALSAQSIAKMLRNNYQRLASR